MLNSVAPSTSQQYSSYVRHYVAFCQLRNLTAFPLYQFGTLCVIFGQVGFTWCYTRSLGSYKVPVCSSWVSSLQEFPSFHRLYLTLRGIKRIQGSTYRKKKRLPITPNLLKVLHVNLFNSSMLYEDKLMTWAAMLTAFFGFLRISEYTSLHSHSFDSNTTLCYRDLKVHTSQSSISKSFPTTIEVNIKKFQNRSFQDGYCSSASREWYNGMSY